MELSSLLGAAATVIAVAFCICTLDRFVTRGRRHEAAWSLSLALFAVGALAFLIGTTAGWAPWSFRLFYLTGGVLTVPVLAVGTVYLLAGRQVGDRVALAVALLGAYATGVVLTAPLVRPLDPDRMNEGREVLGAAPRVLAATGSGLGALVVIAGAVWSAVRLVRGASPAPGARRAALANVLIAFGTLLISLKRPFEVLTGSDESGFAGALTTGLTVIFAGFLLATSVPRAPRPTPRSANSAPAPA